MPFGNRLKEARIKRGFTQEELAKAVGVSKGSIGNYEAEISSPKEDILIRLIKVLNIEPNYLYQDLVKVPSVEPDEEEIMLLLSWRNADESIRSAVRKLLDIPQKKENAAI